MIVLSAPLDDDLTDEVNSTLKEAGIEAMVTPSKEFEIIVDKEELEESKEALMNLAEDRGLDMEVIR